MKIDEIIKIEEINNVDCVYDPCCDAPHNYISNGIISHNCVLWIDEIEKAISGGRSSGNSDAGTTSRVLGTFLTWMQEKTKPVFVVATANDHESIPSEFLRAGRFDEIFFVALPNSNEREEIFSVLLKQRNYKSNKFDLKMLSSKSENYSGAEIEKAIENAMLIGFKDKKRKINTNDIVLELSKFKSLYVMRKQEFIDLAEWAEDRCLKANAEEGKEYNLGLDSVKNLDIDLE